MTEGSEPLEKCRKMPRRVKFDQTDDLCWRVAERGEMDVDCKMESEASDLEHQICIGERAALICKELQETMDKPLNESLGVIEKRVAGAVEYLGVVPKKLTELTLNSAQLQAWIVSESLILSTAVKLLLAQKVKVASIQERGTSSITKLINSTKRYQELELKNIELKKQVRDLKQLLAVSKASASALRQLNVEINLEPGELKSPDNKDTYASASPETCPLSSGLSKLSKDGHVDNGQAKLSPPTPSQTIQTVYANPQESKAPAKALPEMPEDPRRKKECGSQQEPSPDRSWRSGGAGQQQPALRYCPPGSHTPFGPDFAPCGPVFVPSGPVELVCIGPGFTPAHPGSSVPPKAVPVPCHSLSRTSSTPCQSVSTPGFGYRPLYLQM